MAATPRGEKGFSTVELTVVLAVAAAMITATLHTADRMLPRLRARSAAEDLASATRTTRVQAIRGRSSQVMAFDQARGRYTVVRGGYGASAFEHVLHALPKGIRFTTPSGAGDPVTAVPPAGMAAAVEYTDRGRLRSSSVPAYIHVGDPKREIFWRVALDLTGSVRVERWTQGRWQ